MTSIVVTSRQFRDRQRELLDIAYERERTVFIRRGKRMFLLTPVNVEEVINTKLNPKIIKKIKQAEESYRSGNFVRLANPNDLWNSLNI